LQKGKFWAAAKFASLHKRTILAVAGVGAGTPATITYLALKKSGSKKDVYLLAKIL